MLKTAGTTRLVLIVGSYALKIARGETGRRCNRIEVRIWREATSGRKQTLCPVLACRADGLLLLMQAAAPLSEAEAEQHRRDDTFLDWDHIAGGEGEPFEYKASDLGKLAGRLVAVDYSAPALTCDVGEP